MKKLLSYILACLPVSLMVVGCSETENYLSPSSKKVIVTAQMPEADTRANLSQDGNTLNLIAKWQNGDEVKLIIVQGNQKFEVGKVPIENINSDGKKASFSYDIPSELDITKSYMLYAFCGIEGYVDKKENGDWYVYCTARLLRTEMSKLKAPLASCTEVSMTTPVAQFQHFQTYEVLHIKNASSESISFQHEGFDVVNPWYRGVPTLYDFNTWSPGALPQVWHNEASSEAITIPATGIACIISTYLPSGYQMKDAYLRAAINGSLNIVKSSNKKSSDVNIETGHAYHMYATWDGINLKFDNGEAGILTVEPDPIDFGSVEAGTTSTKSFTVSNTGDAELTFEIQSLNTTFFNIPESGKSFTLQSGESLSFTISFTPEAEEKDKSYSDVLTISTNASNATSGIVQVTITGKSKSREQERLTQVIPDELRDQFDDYVPIYDGSNPPNVEGSYFMDPEILIGSTLSYDSYGKSFSSEYMKFSDQDMKVNTINMIRVQGIPSVVEWMKGSGAFISGSDNNFTIYFDMEGESYGIPVKEAVVVSGTKVDGGIEKLSWGFILKEKGDDPNNHVVPVGTFRIFTDKDGMSPSVEWPYEGKYMVRKSKVQEIVLPYAHMAK